MCKHLLLNRFWHDEDGSVLVTDWVVVATILTLGAVAGLVAARQAILADFNAVSTSSR